MLGNRGFPEAWSRLCICQASFLMTLAMSGVPHSGPGTWDFPGKTIGVGCYFLPQGTFLTQGSNVGLLYCRQILYHLSHQGNTTLLLNYVFQELRYSSMFNPQNCWEPAWGTPPMAKVMRKEAWHTQRRDQASGNPLFPSIYPQNQSTLRGALPHNHFSQRRS